MLLGRHVSESDFSHPIGSSLSRNGQYVLDAVATRLLVAGVSTHDRSGQTRTDSHQNAMGWELFWVLPFRSANGGLRFLATC